MACEYCHGEGWHHPRCPLYEEPKPAHYCSICNEGIYNGEEYIVNEDDEYAHFECVSYGKDMAEFLGYEIKEMNEENEKNF